MNSLPRWPAGSQWAATGRSSTPRSPTIERRAKDWDDLATPRGDYKPLHPQYVARLVSDLASEDAIVTADVGTPSVWAARYLRMNGAAA